MFEIGLPIWSPSLVYTIGLAPKLILNNHVGSTKKKKHIIINCKKSNMTSIESLEMELYNII